MATTTIRMNDSVGYITIASPIALTLAPSSTTQVIPQHQVRASFPDSVVSASTSRAYIAHYHIYDSNSQEIIGYIESTKTGFVANASTNANVPAITVPMYASTFFNSSNKTARTVTASLRIFMLEAFRSGDTTASDWIWLDTPVSVATFNVTLDAPPTVTNTAISSSSRNGMYWTEDSAGKANSTVTARPFSAQYGGSIASATLTVGSISATSTTSPIKLPIVGLEAGTYTPTLTVTDSRGQTSTKTFDPITVLQYERATYDITQVMSDTNGFWSDISTASVTIDNISVPTGYVLEKVDFYLCHDNGNLYVTKTLDGTETSITVSSKNLLSEMYNLVGEVAVTPDIRITDSRGIYEHNYLDPIIIRQYTNTSIGAVTLARTTANGLQDDEGVYALLTVDVNYVYQLGNLLEPVIVVTDNGVTSSGIVTWYESWNSSTGIDVSSLINWTNYNPTSPVTLYGLISGYGSTIGFDTQSSFQIAVTARDTQTSSETITQTLDSAFYTIDFLAGGHGIAFGQPASDDGFWCDMDMYLHGHKVPVIYESTLAPTVTDGEDGDIWIQYTV